MLCNQTSRYNNALYLELSSIRHVGIPAAVYRRVRVTIVREY